MPPASDQCCTGQADQFATTITQSAERVSSRRAVTNVDQDHMETYGGDPQRLHQTFIDFLQNLPF